MRELLDAINYEIWDFLLFGEVGFGSVILYYWTNSWWITLFCFFSALIMFRIKSLAIALSIILSIGYAFVGWELGSEFQSLSAKIALSILAALYMGGFHITALESIGTLKPDKTIDK